MNSSVRVEGGVVVYRKTTLRKIGFSGHTGRNPGGTACGEEPGKKGSIRGNWRRKRRSARKSSLGSPGLSEKRVA